MLHEFSPASLVFYAIISKINPGTPNLLRYDWKKILKFPWFWEKERLFIRFPEALFWDVGAKLNVYKYRSYNFSF